MGSLNKSLICNPSTRSQVPGGGLKQSRGAQQQGSPGSSGDDACVGGNDGDVGSMAALMVSMVMGAVVALAELVAVGATEVARV